MYVNPICALLLGGKSTPATRAITFSIPNYRFQIPDCRVPNLESGISNFQFLSLALFMLRIIANHAHHAFSMNDLAFVADLFYRRTHFHNFPLSDRLIACRSAG